MNENTPYPNSNPSSTCPSNCQPENVPQKAKDKHNEDMKHAGHQKMKDEGKNKDSADKKAEKAPGQQA
ncbi:hypothetical protein [Candidatus Electronema sp. PJ]|uniref:hypothetical protein n=1 Tax=Candidatus Electronema sp. PJ TaxID=3401572 RepID=UPI003AA9ACDB